MERLPGVVMGTWHLGGGAWGPVDERKARDLLRSVRDQGVTWFDTARAYGESEAVLGRAFRQELRSDRDSLVIASKTGHRQAPGGTARDSSPDHLREDLETSLKAIGTDRIDLYQLHWVDPDIPLTEVAGQFASFIDQGKIRGVGLCNVTGAELDDFLTECPVAALQLPYSLTRRGIEHTTLRRAQELGVQVMCYGALSHGLLTTATVRAGGFAADDFRSQREEFGRLGPEFFADLRRIEDAGAHLGFNLAQLAVAFCTRPGAADSVIVGAHHSSEIAEALEVAKRRDDVAELTMWMATLPLPEARLLPQFVDGKASPRLVAEAPGGEGT